MNVYTKQDILNLAKPGGFPQLPDGLLSTLTKIDQSKLGFETPEAKLGYIQAIQEISSTDWFFEHQQQTVPTCLILDNLWQITGLYFPFNQVTGKARALQMKGLKVHSHINLDNGDLIYNIYYKRVISRGTLTLVTSRGEVIFNNQKIITADHIVTGAYPR